MLADLFDRFFFSLVEDYLVLLEQVAALGVDGYDQRAELFDTAVPQSLRHTQVSPLSADDLFYLGSCYNCVSSREYTVDCSEVLAGALGVRAHAALTDDDA